MLKLEDRLEAERQISAIIFGYAEAVDEGDLKAVAAYFEHGRIRVHGLDDEHVGIDGVERMFRDHVRFYDGSPATKHVTTNLVIEVEDDGQRAVARSYFTVLQARPELPLQIIIAGRYHDRFERRGARWVLTDRLEYCDLTGDLSCHLVNNVLDSE